VTAFSGIAGASHYAAAKAGLIGLTKSMALELSNKKITVNAIALGYFSAGLIDSVPQNIQAEIKTKIPAGRFGNYDDVGSSVEFLLAATSSFITGQVLHLNGGQY
jgi:3-oxoacyl-[acyl-carrier protein] reductase